jgi:hypothetical protein
MQVSRSAFKIGPTKKGRRAETYRQGSKPITQLEGQTYEPSRSTSIDKLGTFFLDIIPYDSLPNFHVGIEKNRSNKVPFPVAWVR